MILDTHISNTSRAKRTRSIASWAGAALALAALVVLGPTPVQADEGLGFLPDASEHDIEFRTADGIMIKGVLSIPAEESPAAEVRRVPLAILLHAYSRDRDSMQPVVDALLGAGMATAAIDLRGHGASRQHESGRLYVFPVAPVEELRLAVEDLRLMLGLLNSNERLDLQTLAFVGVAEGASIAAAAAARTPEARALVMVDPVAEGAGFQTKRDLGLYDRRPALLICSQQSRSKDQSEAYAEYGLGTREVTCTDQFESSDTLFLDDSLNAQIGTWLSTTLASDAKTEQMQSAARTPATGSR